MVIQYPPIKCIVQRQNNRKTISKTNSFSKSIQEMERINIK